MYVWCFFRQIACLYLLARCCYFGIVDSKTIFVRSFVRLFLLGLFTKKRTYDRSDLYALVQRNRSEKIPAAASSGPAAAPFTMRGDAV